MEKYSFVLLLILLGSFKKTSLDRYCSKHFKMRALRSFVFINFLHKGIISSVCHALSDHIISHHSNDSYIFSTKRFPTPVVLKDPNDLKEDFFQKYPFVLYSE